MAKVTKRFVESLKPAPRDIFAWDDEVRGFGVRVKPSGVRSYLVQYRNQFGRSKRYTIGQHGRMTAEAARTEAKRLLSEVAHGKDPAQVRRDLRDAPTLREFADRYVTEWAISRKKPGTLETDRINLTTHIIPALGNRPVADITHADVVQFHQSMSDTPGAANRTVELLSNIMNVAEKWGVRPLNSNPCRHVEKYKRRQRERFLTEAELARLGDTLAEAERTKTESASAIAAIRLLLFTGCRRGEILTLHWAHVDMQDGCLRLPDSKTGAKVVHLNAPALAVLSNIERVDGNPFVITGQNPGTHLVNLKAPWQRIRKKTGLEDVRLHDLRHSFASIAISGGLPLAMIGKLLGHTQPSTTARYAHLATDPVKRANEIIGQRISNAMKLSAHAGEVMELTRSRD